MKRLLLLASTVAAAAAGLSLGLTALTYPASGYPIQTPGDPAPIVTPVALPAPVVTAAPVVTVTTVRVAGGDTLYGLAVRYGRTCPQFEGLNRLPDPNLITVGEALKVPSAGYRPGPAVSCTRPTPPAVQRPLEGSLTASGGGSAVYLPSGGFEACVIARESGGNPQIMNASGHWGLYQFAYTTWVANGGIPGDWGNAGPAEQHTVFARSSPSNWAPYDGC